MARLINADALANRFDAIAYDDWNQGAIVSWAEAFKVAAEMVRDESAVDVEPVKHGYNTNQGVRWFRCSECGWGMNDIYMADESMVKDFDKFPYYCPFCGAKMDEVEE